MLHYSLLFIHVAAAMAMFTSVGMEAVALANLRQATDDSAIRQSLASFGSSQRVAGPGALVVLLSGMYLATAYWHWKGAWMGLGFLGILAVAAVGGVMTRRALTRVRRIIDGGGAGASALDVMPALRLSFTFRVAVLAGVVFLMTAKPEPPVALGALVLSAVIGIVIGRSGARTTRTLGSGARTVGGSL